MTTPVNKTPMPIVAGILAIAAGGFKILTLVGMICFSFFLISPIPEFELFPVVIMLVISVPLAILGILAIIGGISAVQRKSFGLAVAGSIAAFLPFSLLGLASIILIALSKSEFE
jgi:hypothetical protein